MIGMVYKDILVLRKTLGFYAVFVAVYGVLSITGVFTYAMVPGMAVLMAMMLPMTSFGYDDQARWGKYAAATPAGRRGVVAGKYLFTLLVAGAGCLFSLAFLLAMQLPGLIDVTIPECLGSVGGCLLACLVINALTLPVLIKFGAEKSRIISITLFVVLFGGVLLLARFAKGVRLPALPAWFLGALPVVLVLLAVGGFVISYFVSLGIYGKKEL